MSSFTVVLRGGEVIFSISMVRGLVLLFRFKIMLNEKNKNVHVEKQFLGISWPRWHAGMPVGFVIRLQRIPS